MSLAIAALAPAAHAQDKPAAPPATAPAAEKPTCPEIIDRDRIRMPDGMVVYFYRVKYVDAAALRAELDKWKTVPGGDVSIATVPQYALAPIPALRPASGEPKKTDAVTPPVQNTLRILETEERLAFMEQLLTRLDIPQPQVLIEAKVAELLWDDETRIGVTTSLAKATSNSFFRSVESKFPNELSAFSGAAAVFKEADKYVVFDYMVEAAAQGAKTDVTSQPSILASQGETAIVRAGDEEPVVQQNFTGTTVTTTTTFKPIGIRLEVQPLLIGRDAVRVRISAESSRLTEFRVTATGANQQVVNPVVSSRAADTVVTVPDGGTLIIGGLEQTSNRDVRAGIPLLKDIPGLGYLFGSATKRNTRTELFFWITLKIESPESARLIVPPSEKARQEAAAEEAASDR